MKKQLLSIICLLFIASLTIAQTLPSGHYGRFEFTKGSLVNTSVNGSPISIYPNPTTDVIYMEDSKLDIQSQKLYNLLAASYNESQLSAPHITTDKGTSETQRIIKQ